MTRRKPLKILFYLCLLTVAGMVGYKIYLDFLEPNFEAAHANQIGQLHKELDHSTTFNFVVVGNINNSVGVFERKIIPMLNNKDVDFLISAGNAVSSGGEDKYRAIYRTLQHLHMPYLLTFGENEYSNFGSFRFYEHFGPYFYSFRTGNSRFIFLDTTGKTSMRWQLRWLQDLLERDDSTHLFVFTGRPLFKANKSTLFDDDDDYYAAEPSRSKLINLLARHDVDAVFSANLPVYSEQTHDGVRYITTGGAGGLVLNNETSFYHFVKVSVTPAKVTTTMQPMNIGQHEVFKQLESLWFFIHSLFYVGYINFILLISVIGLIAIKLYAMIFVDRDYYPDFDLDPAPWLKGPLRIAMFTNNYLPFIGGVPLSISRLKQGLQALGHQLLVVAPEYLRQSSDEEDVLRTPSLVAMGSESEFRMASIFVRRIRKKVAAFKPDVVHIHHPIWLGSLGLWVARRLKIPAIYTYHTRLEHYAHFVPLPGHLFRNLISHWLIRHFANKCEGVIVPTASAEEYLRMIGVKSRTFVQPTGIDFESFQAVSAGDIKQLRQSLGITNEHVFISVSRLSSEKNIDFMIDAVASLKAHSDHPFRVLMIGDGHEREALQAHIDRCDLHNHFILLGSVPPEDIATYYRLGDTFLFASKSETQGMVVLEAMAAGLPVVAVRSSGIDDAIREHYNGFKTSEKINQWRDAALRLMENPEHHRAMSENALTSAREHSIDHFARDVQLIYATVLAGYHKHGQ